MAHSQHDASFSSSTGSFLSRDQALLEEMRNPNEERITETREKYLNIHDKLKNYSEENVENLSLENLTVEVAKINALFQTTKAFDEFKMDAETLREASALGRSKIGKKQTSLLTFSPQEYANKLINFLRQGEPGRDIFDPSSDAFKRSAMSMRYLYRSTSGLEPLYGALEWSPPAPAPRSSQRGQRDEQHVQQNRIEKITDSTLSTSEEAQSEEVARIFRVLKDRHGSRKEPIPLMEFVLDPTCFCTSVQNMFHTSFLIRDGHIKLSEDEFKVPCISPADQPGATEGQSEELHSVQGVVMLTMDTWQELVEIIGLTEPMIPKVVRASEQE